MPAAQKERQPSREEVFERWNELENRKDLHIEPVASMWLVLAADATEGSESVLTMPGGKGLFAFMRDLLDYLEEMDRFENEVLRPIVGGRPQPVS